MVLSRELFEVVPKPCAEEQTFIEKVPIGKNERQEQWSEVICRSRLACQINVTKEMNGGVVFVCFFFKVICRFLIMYLMSFFKEIIFGAYQRSCLKCSVCQKTVVCYSLERVVSF